MMVGISCNCDRFVVVVVVVVLEAVASGIVLRYSFMLIASIQKRYATIDCSRREFAKK